MALTTINVAGKPCRECGRMRRFRRGLCWPCYMRPTVRERHAAVRFGFTADDGKPNDFDGAAPKPAEDLPGGPGSDERLEEMRRRAANRQQLFAGGERRPMDEDDYRRLAQRMGPT